MIVSWFLISDQCLTCIHGEKILQLREKSQELRSTYQASRRVLASIKRNTFLHSLAFLCSLLTTIQKRKTAGRLLRLRAHAFLVEG